ncbi:hypothetical protein ACLB2K_040915 [Fragaria x ananassa]
MSARVSPLSVNLLAEQRPATPRARESRHLAQTYSPSSGPPPESLVTKRKLTHLVAARHPRVSPPSTKLLAEQRPTKPRARESRHLARTYSRSSGPPPESLVT